LEQEPEISNIKQLFKEITEDAGTPEIPEEIVVAMIEGLDKIVTKFVSDISEIGNGLDESFDLIYYPHKKLRLAIDEELDRIAADYAADLRSNQVIDRLTERMMEKQKEALMKAVTDRVKSFARRMVITFIRKWIFCHLRLKQKGQLES